MTKIELEKSISANFMSLVEAWTKSQNISKLSSVFVFNAKDYSVAKKFDDVKPELWGYEKLKLYLERIGIVGTTVEQQLEVPEGSCELPVVIIDAPTEQGISWQKFTPTVMDRPTSVVEPISEAAKTMSDRQYVYLMFHAPTGIFPFGYRRAIETHPSLGKYWHEDVFEFNPLSTDYSKIREKAEHHHVVFIYLDEGSIPADYLSETGVHNAGELILKEWEEYPQYVRNHFHMIILFVDPEKSSADVKFPYAKKEAFKIVRIPHGELLKETNANIGRLVGCVEQVIQQIEEAEKDKLNTELGKYLVGETKAIREIHAQIDRYAPEEASVLILGETGTGKELVAQSLHHRSRRPKEKFRAINCAGLPHDLIESELFGHEKGAFTGATKDRKGHFESANGGTLFLDEIGDLPLDLQAKLLRAIQEKNIRRVGGDDDIEIDVRILSATHKDLNRMVRDGVFREDLYYRLNVLKIIIPPLRERREDIPLIVRHYLQLKQDKRGRKVSFAREAMELLARQNWPGNVRELLNVVERTVINSPENIVTAENLRNQFEPTYEVLVSEAEFVPKIGDPLTLKEIEKRHIELILKKNNWVVAKAAKVLGIDRGTLDDKIEKYELIAPK
jgi:DNA-binding NtrC family response regulator